MNIRVLYNILLVRLGIRKVLPGEAIRNVKIMECKEPLISLPIENQKIYGRKSVIEKITEIDNILEKQGYKIHIFEIYRDADAQKNLRLQEYSKMKKENPNYSEAELEMALNKRVANIKNNDVGGHQTGGAVDLTIRRKNGEKLDMGTEYLEFNGKTKTFCKDLTQEQQNNRTLLLKAMKTADFVNYPNEWWHFSYGDRMWAAYNFKREAIYGNVENVR